MFGPGLGGIQQLVGEGARQFRQLFLDFAVTGLLLRRQVDTGQVEVTQFVVQHLALGVVQLLCGRAFGQRLVGLAQLAVLPQFGPEFGQFGQAGLVGFTQLGAVAHRIQVPDRAPGLTQPGRHLIHWQHQIVPAKAVLAFEQFGNLRPAVGQQLVNGRHHMFGLDGGERRQVEVLQQGVGSLGHGAPVKAVQ